MTSRGSIHISRVSTREHPETHEPTHVVSEDKDQSNAFEGNETTSNLLTVNKQVPLTKSILLIELVKLDLNAVTKQRFVRDLFPGQLSYEIERIVFFHTVNLKTLVCVFVCLCLIS